MARLCNKAAPFLFNFLNQLTSQSLRMESKVGNRFPHS